MPPATVEGASVSVQVAKFDVDKILRKLADSDFAKALVEELVSHEDGANIVRRALERDLLA